jgi:hypothetical protein
MHYNHLLCLLSGASQASLCRCQSVVVRGGDGGDEAEVDWLRGGHHDGGRTKRGGRGRI